MLITSTQTVLGDKLENAYSVANMRKAFESLAPEDRGGLSIEDIRTSHYYVKFRPANYDELDRIKQDTTLILYDIPLDYEITSQGEYYQDPEVPDSLPTYQYASVEFAHRAAIDTLGVAYDVLENLFIPDEDRDFVEDSGTRAAASGVGRIDEAVADALVERSLELTGNAEEPDGMTRASKWRPAGQIRYKSTYTSLGWIGLEGIKVKARRWFTTHTGITDANGYYSCNGRFKRPANYHFDWGVIISRYVEALWVRLNTTARRRRATGTSISTIPRNRLISELRFSGQHTTIIIRISEGCDDLH